MAKSVLDAGWSAFRGMLRHKSPGYVEVDEAFTTQTCSGCGSIAGPKGYAGLNKREWTCDDCGASHDRDVNSAINILALALSVERPVEGSRGVVTHA
jgi:putative transposase